MSSLYAIVQSYDSTNGYMVCGKEHRLYANYIEAKNEYETVLHQWYLSVNQARENARETFIALNSTWMKNQPRLITITNYFIKNDIDMNERLEKSQVAYQTLIKTKQTLQEQEKQSHDDYKKTIVKICDFL